MVSIDRVARLPYDTVFRHKNSTEPHWRVAQGNLLLLMEAGSKLHGTSLGDEDTDLVGLCVEPPEVMLGTQLFTEYHYRSVPDGHKSGPEDTDLNVYGLHKWVIETAKGNPNHLLMLFAPESAMYYLHPMARELRERASMFLAREHATRFLGYLTQQRKDIMGQQRPELIKKYGYDVKSAYHALRIATQGLELMIKGKIEIPMMDHQREFLLQVRRGEWPLKDVLAHLKAREGSLGYAQRASSLPETIDYNRINAWLPGFYQRFWQAR